MSHFAPKPSIITERFYFNRKRQQCSESIIDFTAELRRLAINCEFEDKLEDALRDQFASGLQSEAMHKRLLTETERLTFARAVEITSGMETAAKNARSLHESNNNPGIKHVTDHLPCKHCVEDYWLIRPVALAITLIGFRRINKSDNTFHNSTPPRSLGTDPFK